MSAIQKQNNYRGNVTNHKSEDQTWYLKFIRYPKITANAKLIYLNIKTNDVKYNENIKSLMLKCNLTEKAVSKGVKELENLKLLSRERISVDGKYLWTYTTYPFDDQSPLFNGIESNPIASKGIASKGIESNSIESNPVESDRYKYKEINKTNLNKTNNNKDNIKENFESPKEKIVNFLSEEKTSLIKQLTELKIFESVAKDLVFNYSSDIISKQLIYYPYRETSERNAGYLVNAIKNNQDMPDEYKKHLFSLSMKEFLNKHRPVMSIWRCSMGSNLEQLKENIVNPVLVQLSNLDYYRSISKETRPELDETYSSFFDEIQTKFLKTFEIISFKELIDMILEVKANNKDININSISKTISKIINKGV